MNSGILPLTFANEADYDAISQGDELVLPDIRNCVANDLPIVVENKTTGKTIPVTLTLSARQRKILLAGGLLNFTREQA